MNAEPPATPASMPLIIVAMSVRDNAATVGTAIRSVLEQTYPHFEFIVVNDGSVDATAAEIAKFTDPRLRTIFHATSAGLAARLIEIVALARGTFIARMDGDDFSYPERFERQLGWLSRWAKVVRLHQTLRNVDTDRLVAITFDDGFRDNLTVALPLLEKFNMPMTLMMTIVITTA